MHLCACDSVLLLFCTLSQMKSHLSPADDRADIEAKEWNGNSFSTQTGRWAKGGGAWDWRIGQMKADLVPSPHETRTALGFSGSLILSDLARPREHVWEIWSASAGHRDGPCVAELALSGPLPTHSPPQPYPVPWLSPPDEMLTPAVAKDSWAHVSSPKGKWYIQTLSLVTRPMKPSITLFPMQINLQRRMRVTGLITQGAKRIGSPEYVKSYKVAFSDDGKTWNMYKVKGTDEDMVRGGWGSSLLCQHSRRSFFFFF